ncbi:ABC transporter permease [Bacillus sp. BP-3]|uniref:ABC transporter permease n=1 Tax=Bacillus sp. BP-3 TaxID=3022773 RepID=UPI00232FC0AD|nr:FtsX-like permease family protein [Bacillus sp. BP-3]MDC2865502.1 FtsX-like permease family protein [Bacillus sp. BP-3]
MMLWRVSWRNLTRKKLRALITIMAIIIGVSTMFAVISTVETAKGLTNKRLQLYTGNADYVISSSNHLFSKDILNIAEKEKGIQSATAVLHKQSSFNLKEERGFTHTRIRITGLSSFQNELLSLKVLKGNLTNEGIIIPIRTAGIWKLDVKDTITLNLPSGKKTVPIAAIVENTPLLEGPNSWEEASDKSWRALASLATVQSWFHLPDEVQEVRLKFQSEVDAQSVVTSLKSNISDPFVSVQEVVLDEKQTNQLDDLYFMLYAIGGLAMFISTFILYNTLYVSIVERKSEIAIMKTIGYTPFQIKQFFLMEVIILASISLSFGIPLGFGLANILQGTLFNSFQENMVYTMQYKFALPATLCLGIVIPILASIIPVTYASKVNIISTLKNVPSVQTGNGKLRIILGILSLVGVFISHTSSILFLFIGVMLLFPFLMKIITTLLSKKDIFGYEGRIASNNTLLTLNRSSNMSAILAVAICLGLLVSSIFTSLEKNVHTDVTRSFGGNLQFSTETPIDAKLTQIQKINGVKQVSAYKEKEVIWKSGKDTRNFTIISTDLNWYKKNPLFYDPKHKEKELLKQLDLNSNGILLGNYAFKEWGGAIGDTISILQDNNEIKELKVVGKVNASMYGGYTAFMAQKNFDAHFNGVEAHKGLILTTNNASENIVKQNMLQTFYNDLSEIQTLHEEIEKQKRALPGVKSLFNGLLIIAIIVSGIGILNALIINVIDRVREIAIMRAVAFTTTQVYKMIIYEGLIIGINGVVIGVILGIFTIYLNTSFASDPLIEFSVPLPTLVTAIISGILVSCLSAILPAYQAANSKLDRALKED